MRCLYFSLGNLIYFSTQAEPPTPTITTSTHINPATVSKMTVLFGKNGVIYPQASCIHDGHIGVLQQGVNAPER